MSIVSLHGGYAEADSQCLHVCPAGSMCPSCSLRTLSRMRLAVRRYRTRAPSGRQSRRTACRNTHSTRPTRWGEGTLNQNKESVWKGNRGWQPFGLTSPSPSSNRQSTILKPPTDLVISCSMRVCLPPCLLFSLPDPQCHDGHGTNKDCQYASSDAAVAAAAAFVTGFLKNISSLTSSRNGRTAVIFVYDENDYTHSKNQVSI